MNGITVGVRPTRSPLRASERTTLLRPVSRISFMLTDTDAFEKSARFAVEWLEVKTGGLLPAEALDLQSFDTRGVDGFHPCHAVRLDDHQGSVWAARVDEPGSRPEAGETWSTELFVERRSNSLVRFGAQLTARRPNDAEPLRPSRPRVVHDLLRALSAEADGEALSENVAQIERQHVEGLADLIYRSSRRLPVVVVSTDEQHGSQVDLGKLALRLSGAAHLAMLDPEASWELTRLLDKRMSTFNGAVRIYMPGVVEDEEDPFQHPLWLAPPSGRNSRLIDILAERIFPLGFRDSEGDSQFWHLAQLRQTISVAEARMKSGTETERLQAEITALNDQIEDLKETLETAQALEEIAAGNEKAAQQDVERLKDENDRLRSALYRFQQAEGAAEVQEKPANRRLANYDDLESWADEVLGPHIVIHRKALKDCRQNGHPDMLERIERTLLAIRDHWIPHKLKPGLDRRNAAMTALGLLGVEDEACFARREKAKEKQEYSVRDGDLTRVLYDHFKYGNSRNNAEQFRIYYAWDDENRRLIIGKMPSHLANDMS
jgi:hypothetical protein